MKITTFTKENKKHVMLSDGMYDSFLGFRIREKGVDLKVRTEIKVVGELWDCNTNSYKRTRKLSADEQKKFNTLVTSIIDTLTDEFDYTTASAEWIREVVANCINPKRKESSFPTFAERIEQYRRERLMEVGSSKAFIPTINKLNRFVAFKREIEGNEEYELHVETIQADDFEDFRDYVVNEWHLREEYPVFYAQFDFGNRKPKELSRTGIINIMHHLRIVHHWCIRQGITTNKACDEFTIPAATYGTPYYLTLDERNIIYDADFSDNPTLDLYRDMFIFQSLVGCRSSDLFKFTFENIHKGVLSFVPQKTKKKTTVSVQVPLNSKAMAILRKHKAGKKVSDNIFPRKQMNDYNLAIRAILKKCGINRTVTILNGKTNENEQKPISEVASSHMARRTFIGNLYKKVKDPLLISSLTGHVNGSRAFARYREIDEETKLELVNMIN